MILKTTAKADGDGADARKDEVVYGHFVVYAFLPSPGRAWRIFAEQLMFPPRFAPQSRPLIGANATVAAFVG
jgi:hypothetical protein